MNAAVVVSVTPVDSSSMSAAVAKAKEFCAARALGPNETMPLPVAQVGMLPSGHGDCMYNNPIAGPSYAEGYTPVYHEMTRGGENDAFFDSAAVEFDSSSEYNATLSVLNTDPLDQQIYQAIALSNDPDTVNAFEFDEYASGDLNTETGMDTDLFQNFESGGEDSF